MLGLVNKPLLRACARDSIIADTGTLDDPYHIPQYGLPYGTQCRVFAQLPRDLIIISYWNSEYIVEV